TTDQFLINPYGMLYEEIDASSLIKVDVEGNTLLNESDYDVNVAGFVIHSAIHMAKHDMDCVAHTHTPAGMAVSAMECGLLPLAQTSMRFLCASGSSPHSWGCE
ncbi:class II aldolase/adducin family protein, partial [Acinetobacter baumannii]|uniref:class II aldolase/adducin family protein n=1 Tax=Acinetobacter baumannii TaxID=470 RepID=UPI001BB46921